MVLVKWLIKSSARKNAIVDASVSRLKKTYLKPISYLNNVKRKIIKAEKLRIILFSSCTCYMLLLFRQKTSNSQSQNPDSKKNEKIGISFIECSEKLNNFVSNRIFENPNG